MSDGLPSDEQLRRIERGVQRRIRGRRVVGQRLAGTVVALLLVVGGIALVRPAPTVSGSASSAGGSSAGGSSALVPVVCHADGATRTVRASAADLPASAFAACAARPAERTASAASSAQAAEAAPSPAPVLCRASSGVLHVYSVGAARGGAATCAEHAMTRVGG